MSKEGSDNIWWKQKERPKSIIPFNSRTLTNQRQQQDWIWNNCSTICCLQQTKVVLHGVQGYGKNSLSSSKKGVCFKLNPDAHYSCSMYKMLDKLQLTDGHDKIEQRRPSWVSAGHYSYTLPPQSTVFRSSGGHNTYRFSWINTPLSCKHPRICLWKLAQLKRELHRSAGMVKNHFSFRKNPSQHAADFKFLKTTQEFKTDNQ